MENRQDISIGLPEALRGKFVELEKRLRATETSLWVAGGLSGIFGSYLLQFLSDRIWNSPMWFRTIAALTGWGLVAAGTTKWVWRWVVRRRGLREFSVLVQQRFRLLGDRLLGIVELANEETRPAGFSPALYEAAIHQVAMEAGRYDFREAVPAGKARKLSLLATFLALAVALSAIIFPPAAANAALRWIAPLAAIPRFTLVQFAGLPRELIVPHGEPFEISASVNYRSFWKPSRGRLELPPEEDLRAEARDGKISFKIPSQVKAGILHLRLGDARAEVAIKPTYRPSLKQLTATVAPPDYLGYPAQEYNLQGGSLSLLRGSSVAFHAIASRPLKEASIQSAGESKPLSLTPDGFSSEPRNFDEVNESLFDWNDQLGLAGAAPWHLTFQLRRDAAPAAELHEMPADFSMLETDVLPLKVDARDDFGVKEAGFQWAPADSVEPKSEPHIERAQTETKQQKEFEASFPFSPSLAGIPADSVIEVTAFATDFFPGREPVRSSVYRIHILGDAAEAGSLKQQWEQLFEQIEEIARVEDKVASVAGDLRDLPPAERDNSTNVARASAAQGEQSRNAEQLKQIAEAAEQLVEKAIRNPEMDASTVGDWAASAQSMQSIAAGSMGKASQSLSSAASSPSSEARETDLANASEQAADALQALQQLQKGANKGLDRVDALTLAQRLRQVATGENKIAAALRSEAAETLGLPPQDLPPSYVQANEKLATTQSAAQQETENLRGELSRFAQRANEDRYAQISKEMTDSKASEEVGKIAQLITDNVTMKASLGLADWAKKFNDWAARLSQRNRPPPGGSGDGGSDDDDDMTRVLVALLRMREGEINLRARTALLADGAATFDKAATALDEAQRSLLGDLVDLQTGNDYKPIDPPLKEANDGMQSSSFSLGRPQADAGTLQAQQKAVDGLSDAINLLNEEQDQADATAQQQPGQGQGQSQARALRRMMGRARGQGPPGQSAGSSPGGSMGGGTTDKTPPALGKAGNGNGSESRQVNRASGSTQDLPAEFRDAIESFYHSLENPNE